MATIERKNGANGASGANGATGAKNGAVDLGLNNTPPTSHGASLITTPHASKDKAVPHTARRLVARSWPD